MEDPLRDRIRRRLAPLGLRLQDHLDLLRSRSVDLDSLETVSVTLGPYRNLTTLTASVLFLHPECQVLNHAASRVFGRPEIDFLAEPDPDTLDRFAQFAIVISGKGYHGHRGGSITRSHAFAPEHDLPGIFDESGLPLVKRNVRCLHWKESLRTSNRIRDEAVDLSAFFARDPRLKFLMPIRNPLDCAVSNLKTGHAALFPGLDAGASLSDVAGAIVREFAWFDDLRQAHPDRFFHFYEYSISHDMLRELAEFLRLRPDGTWIDRALVAMRVDSAYEHPAELVASFREQVDGIGDGHPELARGLLRFYE